MIAIVAESARVAGTGIRTGFPRMWSPRASAAEKFTARAGAGGRSEAREGDRHVLDLHGGARPQRLDLRTARIIASTGADTGAAMSGAVGALSRAAPRRRSGAGSLPMLDGWRAARPGGYVRSLLEQRRADHGFGHRVYRAEDPRARLLRRTAQELGSPRFEVAEQLERVALAALREYQVPDAPSETNVEFTVGYVVLDVARDSA